MRKTPFIYIKTGLVVYMKALFFKMLCKNGHLPLTYCRYLDPLYDFDSQESILKKCVEIVREHKNRETLFLVGSYTVGE